MNKVIAVNIGGVVFNVDEQAYDMLKNYLDSIRGHFSGTDGNHEIISDIESRIAEMLQEKLTPGKQSISKDDVETVIKIMGMPKDFADADGGSQQENKSYSHTEYGGYRSGSRRLFRDGESKVLGGVCSGIANYFGGIDPVWIRLFFVVIFFTFGSGLLIYVILWIIIPKAKTTSEKLEMRGEPINLHNIQKNVEEEFDNLKKNINDFKTSGRQEKFKREAHDVADSFVDFLTILAKAFAKFFAAIAIGVGFALLLAFILYISGYASNTFFIGHLFDDYKTRMLAISAMCLVVGIPLLMLIIKGFQTLFNFKNRSKLIGRVGGVLWFGGVIMLMALGLLLYRNNKTSVSTRTTLELKPIKSDTLYISATKEEGDEEDWSNSFHWRNKDFHFNTDDILNNVQLDIRQSDGNEIELDKLTYARGGTILDASKNTSLVEYNFTQKDSLITFDRYCSITKNTSWKLQRVKLILYIPVGKTIFLSPSLENFIYDIKNVNNEYDTDMLGHHWLMTKRGLVCMDCGNELPKGNRHHRHKSTDDDKDWEAAIPKPNTLLL
ncbi:MAG: PspC domain-containing protein [Bacteroidetes bacterium]|nr:PspC domain-containing protein [Bacteroidota bacterium]